MARLQALIKFRGVGLFEKDSHRLCQHSVAHYDYLLRFNQLQTACSVTILSLEATICTTVHSNEAKSLKAYVRHVAKSAAYLEGSVAELSLVLWTLGPW